ncbi:MAG TPA: alcohol dehydrogenase catalytic domain-containing protein [Sphingobium sp.]|nr:alcohol dehydrogenase catalytic domain-containing protein [Sphingobium sp.]
MRAAIFRGAGKPLAIEEVPDPQPGRSDVLVKIGRCGVCGTDLHTTSGHGADLPIGSQLGHEYAGEVIEVGPGVSNGLKTGAKVSVMPVSGCGACAWCLSGNPMSCQGAFRMQTSGFAEYVAVDQSAAILLPQSLSLADGALVEPLGVGLHGVVQADIKPGAKVLVLGAGSVGLAAIFWARRLGAGRIVAASPSARRAAMAGAMGADGFETLGEGEAERINAALGGPPDVVFECAGAVGLLAKSAELVRVGGVVVSLGFCMAPDTIVPAMATLKQLTLKFSYTYTKPEFIHCADVLDQGHVEPRMMITDTISLDAFPARLEQMRAGEPVTKLMVDPWMK